MDSCRSTVPFFPLSFSITTSKKIRTNTRKDSSKRDIIEVVKSDNTYLASLKNAIVYTRSKAKNGSMIIAFDGLKMDKINFSKCGLVRKSIGFSIEMDLQDIRDRLTHVFCDYDRNEERI
ncbi:hypothetical protein CAEBREN_05869 [Caenorhabditis brenneri]|uniref:Uncharacterized protein n=1 Tax=Caenorhabditis brenneri TaxID=135651 RepID=G0P7U0_CAEBE|nr:hypothetical protein CAEBREN_05869 [Caenorhabditis brenneri]